MSSAVVKKAFDTFAAEIRETPKRLSGEINQISTNQTTLMSLVNEVKQLKLKLEKRDKEMEKKLKEKDLRINGLEKRIEDLEQYPRKEDIIINGLKTTHRTYAGAATDQHGEDSPLEEQQSLESQVIQCLESQDISIERNRIAACHSLPSKDKKRAPNIIIRLVNRKHKVDLMKQAKKLKGTKVFMNEHLTKRNADIAREARMLRKMKKIQATWTRDCKVFIKLNGSSPEEAKVLTVRELSDLDKFR